jgi:hypothetical protein
MRWRLWEMDSFGTTQIQVSSGATRPQGGVGEHTVESPRAWYGPFLSPRQKLSLTVFNRGERAKYRIPV